MAGLVAGWMRAQPGLVGYGGSGSGWGAGEGRGGADAAGRGDWDPPVRPGGWGGGEGATLDVAADAAARFRGLLGGGDADRAAAAAAEAEAGPPPALEGLDPEPLARRLSRAAQERSLDQTRPAPVLAKARAAGALPWQMALNPRLGGGKMDDVTAVVALVVRAGP